MKQIQSIFLLAAALFFLTANAAPADEVAQSSPLLEQQVEHNFDASYDAEQQEGVNKLPLQVPMPRSTVQQFTLGSNTEGAIVLYSNIEIDDNDQPRDVLINFIYPSAEITTNLNAIITKIDVYLEVSSDGDSQVYVAEGGIGDKSVTLQLKASTSEPLRYMIIIYGKNE